MEHSEGEPWQDTGAAGHCESAANLPPPSARNACTGMDAVMNLNLSFAGKLVDSFATSQRILF